MISQFASNSTVVYFERFMQGLCLTKSKVKLRGLISKGFSDTAEGQSIGKKADSRFREREAKTGSKVYFADAYSGWQGGPNEKTNGVIRQYLSKGRDLRSGLPQQSFSHLASTIKALK